MDSSSGKRTQLLIFISFLLLFSLACQTVTRVLLPEKAPLVTDIATAGPSASPATEAATDAPTETEAVPTQGELTPTLAYTETLEPTADVEPSQLQLDVFDDVWDTIRDQYLYEDFNGLDWEALYDEYRPKVEAGLTDDQFYELMDEMVASLGDEHSAHMSPDEVAEDEAQFAGENDYVGIGILISPFPDRERGVILVTFPGSPAEEAGLKSRDSILAVNGEPILDEEGFLKDILRGPEGTQIVITAQSPHEEPRDLTVTRRRIKGSVPVPFSIINGPNGERFGYLLLVTFNDSTVDDQVREALEEMTRGYPLDGLIIDNRLNEGGADSVLIGTLSYFTQGELGYFISRDEQRPLRVPREEINGSQDVPLVVLVGEGTASYGEVFAGVLKDNGRAYLIGETTDGNVETLWGYDFEDGSRLWLAHESFRPFFHPEENWEELGIVPHQNVPVNWDEYSVESDPAVLAALDHLTAP